MSDTEIETCQFDLFVFNEGDRIIDLYDDLKSRVPYFFANTSITLYSFILDHIFNKNHMSNKYNDNDNDYWNLEYNNEIKVTLNVVNNYLFNAKKRNHLKCGEIQLKPWQNFCKSLLQTFS